MRSANASKPLRTVSDDYTTCQDKEGDLDRKLTQISRVELFARVHG